MQTTARVLTIRREAVKTPAHYRPLAPSTVFRAGFRSFDEGERYATHSTGGCSGLDMVVYLYERLSDGFQPDILFRPREPGLSVVECVAHTEIFAAGVAGAPITDLVSNYGNHHWSSGIAETDHIETGQQRMEVPLWEDLPACLKNEAAPSWITSGVSVLEREQELKRTSKKGS